MKFKYLKEDWWLYLACYFTGYSYDVVRQTSEISKKNVRKMFSALLLVMIIWGFIGFSFTQRYLHGNLFESLIVMIVMVFVIVQIERQIILTMHRKIWAMFFRGLIGVISAIIGSIIIDQVIFKEDIDIAKYEYVQNKIAVLLPQKTSEIQNQINDLKTQLKNIEAERTEILKEIQRQPTILAASKTHTSATRDTTTGAITKEEQQKELISIVNPKMAYLNTLDAKITELNGLIDQYQQRQISIHTDLENELKSKTGFLDEIKVMISILTSSWIPLVVWTLIFAFFLFLELFVLVNKWGDKEDDYQKILFHQLETNQQKIATLKS